LVRWRASPTGASAGSFASSPCKWKRRALGTRPVTRGSHIQNSPYIAHGTWNMELDILYTPSTYVVDMRHETCDHVCHVFDWLSLSRLPRNQPTWLATSHIALWHRYRHWPLGMCTGVACSIHPLREGGTSEGTRPREGGTSEAHRPQHNQQVAASAHPQAGYDRTPPHLRERLNQLTKQLVEAPPKKSGDSANKSAFFNLGPHLRSDISSQRASEGCKISV
jgi:hypothetical protein